MFQSVQMKTVKWYIHPFFASGTGFFRVEPEEFAVENVVSKGGSHGKKRREHL